MSVATGYPERRQVDADLFDSVPRHWNVMRLARAVRLVTQKAAAETGFKIGLEHVEGWSGRYLPTETEEFEGEGVAFQQGDVLFGKLRPYLAKAWLADRAGAAVGDFHVYRPHRLEGQFLRYLLLTAPHVDLVNGSTYGSKMPRASWDFIGSVLQPVPPLDEQRQIAEYLNRETGQIDALIVKQEQLVETLTERLLAFWSSLVTDLNGEWPTVQLRRVVASIVDGPFGSSLTSAHYSDDGTRVIRLGNIGIFGFKNDDSAYIPSDYGRELAAHAVVPGDVIIAGLGDEKMPLGRAAVVPDDIGEAIVKADCYRVRPNATVSARFLSWILSSPQLREQFQTLSRGSTRQRLNTTIVRDARIPLPTHDVQTSVVNRFDELLSQQAELKAKATSVILLLRERRQALISAAVTGKIDVRGL